LTEQKVIAPPHKPDLKEKIFFFISGLIVSVPMTLFLSDLTNGLCVYIPLFYAQLCATIIVAPLIEEFSKVFPLFYRHGETEKSIFILGLFIGSGFGFAEYLIYVLALNASVIGRIPLIILHAATASISAYGVAKKKPAPFLALAMALHLGNNLFATALSDFWAVGGLIIFTTTYLSAYFLYRRTTNKIVN